MVGSLVADLWDRLRAAKSRTDEGSQPEPKEEPAPEGWTWVAPLVAHRCLSFDLDPGFWRAVAPSLEVAQWSQTLCFDTETTGLSGGAGTVPFLVGWAVLTPGESKEALPGVEVHQWFLRDLPGETDMVRVLDHAFGQASALVSFNGASFDLPLLRSRWSLVGRSFPQRPHRDNLHRSRRLWKRLLESCRLGRLEETVLGIRRVDDVPGALVPALWFDYLRQGATPNFAEPLEGVLRHHAQDVYSLLCLDLVLEALDQDPRDPRWEPTFGSFPIRPGVARLAPAGLLHPNLGQTTPVDFWGLIEKQEEEQKQAALEHAWTLYGTEALGLAWAEALKKQRDPRAATIWTRLWESNQSFVALEELLKWLEHRERGSEALNKALVRIEQAMKRPFLPRAWKDNLERRRTRLEKKLLSSGAAWAYTENSSGGETP